MAWAPLPPEPQPVGWWADRETADQFEVRRWAEGRVADVAARRAAAVEREAQVRRVRLGFRMRACRDDGHPWCGARAGDPCEHPALPEPRRWPE